MENGLSNGVKLTNAVYKVLEFFPESDPLKNRAKDKALSIMDSLVLLDETSGWASFQKEKVKVQILEDIDMLLGYLFIAKSQGWLNSVNYLIIANQYEKIRNLAVPVLESTQKLPGIEKTIIEKEETKIGTPIAEEKAEIYNVKITEKPEESPVQKPDKSPLGHFDGPVTIPPKADLVGEATFVAKKNQPSEKLTVRQKQIIDFLNKNEKAQVMDLQTVLPEVTKRTIRRDLDELLNTGKIIRHGDFNQVAYKLNQNQVLPS